MIMEINENITEKLDNLTVRILEFHQTGFFISQSIIVTCAHGNKLKKLEIGDQVNCLLNDLEFIGNIDYINYEKDVIFISYINSYNVKLLGFSSDMKIPDEFYSFGYTKNYSKGEPCTVIYEGLSREPFLIKLKDGAIAPGMSGAPLLLLRTGKIVGMIKSSRTINNKSLPTGGRAIPISLIMDLYKNNYNISNIDSSVVSEEDLEIVYRICEAAYTSANPLKMDLELIKHLKSECKFIELVNSNDNLRCKSIKLWHSINSNCLRFIISKNREKFERIGVTCVLPLKEESYMSYKKGYIAEFCLSETHIISNSDISKYSCYYLCVQSFAFIGKCPRNIKSILRESFERHIAELVPENKTVYIIAEIGTDVGRKIAEYFKMKMLDTISYDKRPLYELILNPNDVKKICNSKGELVCL